MIKINGSAGGQILRTSLSLSALTKKPFKIMNIRANRKEPGLKEQHLQAVKAMKKLCSADVDGAKLGGREIIFKPGEITKKQLRIDVRTAGSTGLILQTLFLACLKNDLRVKIVGGGNWNLYAPSLLYLEEIFLPLLRLNSKINILKNGFYPRGGAIVEAQIKKTKLEEIDLTERGELREIQVFSVASDILKKGKVAERQERAAINLIGKKYSDVDIKKTTQYVSSLCAGSGILCNAVFDNTILGYDVVGERGKQSEKVGEEAARGLLENINHEGCVDGFMIDMILAYLALAKGSIRFNDLTEHAKTNIEVIKKFLDVEFEIKKNLIGIKE